MGRPRNYENQGLPQNLVCRRRKRASGKVITYYFYTLADKSEKSLGTNKHQAILEAAKLNLDRSLPNEIITFHSVVARYMDEIVPNKAETTIIGNKHSIGFLKKFFDNPTLEQIEPKHIREYLTWRKDKPSSANREVTLFHHIWAMAREWGYTKLPCPSDGIAKHKVKPRDVYVEDHVYQKVHELCDQDMKDLMDIAYLTGQRPVDIVKIHRSHIYDGILHITQQKTGAKLRIAIIGQLQEIVERRLQDKEGYLFLNTWGNPMTRALVTNNFLDVKRKAIALYPELRKELEQFQFRDLRAKAGTDKSLSAGDDEARKQLGHTSLRMTKRYIRKDKVISPTK